VLLCILDLTTVGVDAQSSQLLNQVYLILSGYDVLYNTQPISTIFVSTPQVALAICQYACTVTANCAFSVLRSNNTCSTYATSARSSIFVSSTSTIYEIQSTDGFAFIIIILKISKSV
jgi:hypothetical protein